MVEKLCWYYDKKKSWRYGSIWKTIFIMDLFNRRTMENVPKRLYVKFINKIREKVKVKTMYTSTGSKSNVNYRDFSFKKVEVWFHKPTFLGYAVLELSNLRMYNTYHLDWNALFLADASQLHYLDLDYFVLGIKTKGACEGFSEFQEIGSFFDVE